MKRLVLNLITAIPVLLVLAGCSGTRKEIEKNFADPEAVQTSVYWYWISGNISEEGVVKDLHAMKAAGIDRAFIGNIGIPGTVTPYRKIDFASEEWWKILHTAMKTATELGIDIGMFNSPGWSQSGGPWVKAGQAMRYLASVTREVKGGQRCVLDLNHPDPDFQEVKVIAFPSVTAGTKILNQEEVSLTTDPWMPSARNMLDGDRNTITYFKDKEIRIDLKCKKDFILRSLKIQTSRHAIKATGRLSVRAGSEYKVLTEFEIDRTNSNINVGFDPYAPIAVTVPTTGGREFRLEIKNIRNGGGIAEIECSSLPVIGRYPEKTLAKMYQSPLPYWEEYQWPDQPELDDVRLAIDPGQVVDLSAEMKDGVLRWDVPDGNWTVMRTGMLPTGVKNGPADPEATGLETDKMSRKHIRSHFEAYMGEIMRRIPEADRKCWKVVVQDSYETGGQNFTDGFLEEFKARFHYDALPFLPVYSGLVVGSRDRSDRFLWDMRRMVADKIAHDYVGGLRDVAHEHGLTTWLENYGHWGFPGEFLQYGGQSDEIGGEFWSFGNLGNIENRAASSCGHIYGKKKISAESFTSGGRPFSCYPAMMKQRGDRFFSEGINNTLLHVYISQPSDERVPGVNAWFNSEFNRHNTWFSQMDVFTTYLKRNNYMLQQGINIADAAYFIGEDTPKMTGITDPPLPEGYQFDYINAEVLEEKMTVADGLLALPHGTRYRILVLPRLKTMRPRLLEKIKYLVEEGAVVMGPAPERSPSGTDYGRADKIVSTMAEALWKGLDGKEKKSKAVGKGQLLLGMTMDEALKHIGCLPDCSFSPGAPLLYGHRSDGKMDIYFISNQSGRLLTEDITFRVNGKQPELWNALDGSIRDLPEFSRNSDGTTTVPIRLHPYESSFIVFHKKAGKASSKTNYPGPVLLTSLDGPWKVDFSDKKRGPKEEQTFEQLQDISKHQNPGIRYYSGTIRYSKDFDLPSKGNGKIFLDLNRVGVMAKIKVNGEYAGGVWTPPYRIEVGPLLKEGRNHLEIEVVTTWQNRLIGDSRLPENERTTWAVCNPSKPDDALQPSGLIGPVSLLDITY